MTADEKTAAMRTNYNDPFADTLKNLQNSSPDVRVENKLHLYEPPATS